MTSTPRQTCVFLQDACLEHRFIRSKDDSAIYERPERLRAVKLGVAAGIARLEEAAVTAKARPSAQGVRATETGEDALTRALDRLNIEEDHSALQTASVTMTSSSASVDILNNPAVKFIHGDVDGDVYLEKVNSWAQESHEKISKGESEIPAGFNQGDLYLCPGSITAIQGAIGTVCEAVDVVINASRESSSSGSQSSTRAFVAVRPPGHHCGEDTPSGFCFVNNVAIGAAHAHLEHGINRVVILDIDLHHGNGTQAIVWQINEEAYRQTLESEWTDGAPPLTKRGPVIYYGSIHDILSYPCEDGKLDLVQAASTSIHGPHGQYIENVHLQPYTSEEDFFNVLYPLHYSKILARAEDFLKSTGGPGDDVLILISAGFDACEHEYPAMSRHGRKVPTSFFARFTQDTCSLAEKYAHGRVISVLEGGYSDRALTGGAMAHLFGLADVEVKIDETWWGVENLVKLEKAAKKRRGGRQSLTATQTNDPWLERSLSLFATIHTESAPSQILPPTLAPMTLRERKKPGASTKVTPTASPASKGAKPPSKRGKKAAAAVSSDSQEGTPETSPTMPEKRLPRVLLKLPAAGSSEDVSKEGLSTAPKKLPRVVLKLGPPPHT